MIEIGLSVVIGTALAALGTLGISVLFARVYDRSQSRRFVKPVILCDESLGIAPTDQGYDPVVIQVSFSEKTAMGLEILRVPAVSLNQSVSKEFSPILRPPSVVQYPQVDPTKVAQSDNPFVDSYNPG